MKVKIPFELDKTFVEAIAQSIIQTIEQQQSQGVATNELPPYPNRKQVKAVLKIGDERLNQWISEGLNVIPFGKEQRFDRDDIKKFLHAQKI